MEAQKRVNDLIVIAGHLATLLERENLALRARRMVEVGDTLSEKNALVRAFESRVEGLAEQADDLTQVDPDLRERLAGIGVKVNRLIDENARLLKIAIEANRRVMDSVAEAVKSSRPGASTYSANGAVENGRHGVRNVSISVDQTL